MGTRLKRYHILAKLPADLNTADVAVGDALYGISIGSRDSPMPAVKFMDQCNLIEDLVLRFTAYRTIAAVEVVKGSRER